MRKTDCYLPCCLGRVHCAFDRPHSHGVGFSGTLQENGGTASGFPLANHCRSTQHALVAEDVVLSVAAPGVLDGDADPEGDPLTAVLVAQTTGGVVDLNDDSIVGGNTVTVALTVNAVSSGPNLSHGVVNVGSAWETVNLTKTYTSIVVVATPNYDSGDAPGVVRIQNAAGNSFQIRVDAAGATAVGTMDVHYVVMEEGVYDEAGYKIEAVKFTSTVTDENNSWSGESRSYQQAYASPVVVGQVMTYNDPAWSVFWAAGGSRTSIPSGSALTVGKHVGEDGDTTRADEMIGYIVIETNASGTAQIEGLPYVAAVGGDTIRGMGNSPGYDYSYAAMANSKTAVGCLAGMDGGDGGCAADRARAQGDLRKRG
mgnify:CR=1 FL=1